MVQEDSKVIYDQYEKRGEVKEGDQITILLNGSTTIFDETVATGKRANFKFNFEEYDFDSGV